MNKRIDEHMKSKKLNTIIFKLLETLLQMDHKWRQNCTDFWFTDHYYVNENKMKIFFALPQRVFMEPS